MKLYCKKGQLMEVTNTLKQQNIIIHVILLSKTFINATNIDHSFIPKYKMYHSIRDDRKGDGVALYILGDFNCTGN